MSGLRRSIKLLIEKLIVGRYLFENWNKCITITLIRRIGTRNRSKDETVYDLWGMFFGGFCYVNGVFFGGIKRVPVSVIELQSTL